MSAGRARAARCAAALALVGILGPGALAAGPGLAQVRVPPDFKLPTADGSPGEVTFGHARHLAKVGKCSVCHMRDFKLKRGGSGTLTMAALQEGRFCGACHDGKTQLGGAVVFSVDECDRCHK